MSKVFCSTKDNFLIIKQSDFSYRTIVIKDFRASADELVSKTLIDEIIHDMLEERVKTGHRLLLLGDKRHEKADSGTQYILKHINDLDLNDLALMTRFLIESWDSAWSSIDAKFIYAQNTLKLEGVDDLGEGMTSYDINNKTSYCYLEVLENRVRELSSYDILVNLVARLNTTSSDRGHLFLHRISKFLIQPTS